MGLTFKKATEKDIPIIRDLADRIWRKHYLPIIGIKQIEFMLAKMYSPESIVKQMQEQQQYTIAYDDTGKAIGYISISTTDNKNYYLHKFYIDTDKQSKGIGSEVFNYILNTLPTAETIELTVNRENYKSINFYFKNGFVIKEVANFDIGEGYFMNDFVMQKKLTKV